jgi:hypothetical protein
MVSVAYLRKIRPDSRLAIWVGRSGKFCGGCLSLVPIWILLANSGGAAEVLEKATFQELRSSRPIGLVGMSHLFSAFTIGGGHGIKMG